MQRAESTHAVQAHAMHSIYTAVQAFFPCVCTSKWPLLTSAASLNQPFTPAEVQAHLASLHANRSPASLGFPAEFFKGAWTQEQLPSGRIVRSYTLVPTLTAILNALLRTSSMPEALNTALLTPIHKRGDPLNTQNYRPIAVGDPIYRLYSSLLNPRLMLWTEEQGIRASLQAGFRPSRSTLHQLFALRHAVDKYSHKQQPLFTCFVDLRKAYDKVQHNLLWKVLDILGIHGHMRGAIQSLYEGASLAVRVDSRVGQGQHPSIGVKQGCPLSPLLFGLVVDALDVHLKARMPNAGVELARDLMVVMLMYADDVVLLAQSHHELQMLIDEVQAFCNDMGMQINTEKTEVVVFRPACQDLYPHVWTVQGQALPQSKRYKYLGLVFQNDCLFKAMLAAVIQRGRLGITRVHAQVSKLAMNNPPWVALQLFKTYAESSFLYGYGTELWGTKLLTRSGKKHAAELQKLQAQFIKRTCGVSVTIPTPIVMAELQARPIEHAYWRRILQFWNELGSLPEHDVYHRMLLDNLKDAISQNVHNWSYELITGARKMGFDFPIRCDALERIDIGEFQEFLDCRDGKLWENLDVCPRTCTDRVRMCTYYRWFARPVIGKGSFLRIPLSARDMRRVLGFRMGCHKLPVEVGRRQNIPRHQRVCDRCNSGAVGDERHLLLECTALHGLRQQYARLILDSRNAMRLLMWHKDQVLVNKYILACLRAVDVGA